MSSLSLYWVVGNANRLWSAAARSLRPHSPRPSLIPRAVFTWQENKWSPITTNLEISVRRQTEITANKQNLHRTRLSTSRCVVRGRTLRSANELRPATIRYVHGLLVTFLGKVGNRQNRTLLPDTRHRNEWTCVSLLEYTTSVYSPPSPTVDRRQLTE